MSFDNLDAFIDKFNGMTEPYFFYGNTIELRYEPKDHVYYLLKDGEFIAQEGVTTILHIVDKSDALIPWGCKMMAAKILASAPIIELPTGERIVPQLTLADFETLILGAKGAHKEKLEEAASVGSAAHNWIEEFINALLTGNAVATLDMLPTDPSARNCCFAAMDWMLKHRVRWVCTERKIYSRQHGYAGTMDGLCYVSSCGDPLCCEDAFADRLSVVDWKSSNYLYVEYILQTAAYQQAQEEELGLQIEDRWVIRMGKDDGEFDPWHFSGRELYQIDFQRFKTCLDLYRAIRELKARVKERANMIKEIEKAKARAEKEAAMRIKCAGSDKYKGVRPPRCNKGNPCQYCLTKYQETHPIAHAS